MLRMGLQVDTPPLLGCCTATWVAVRLPLENTADTGSRLLWGNLKLPPKNSRANASPARNPLTHTGQSCMSYK
jgi:hypothetical protein